MQTAIDNGLAASPTAIVEKKNEYLGLNVFPNPVMNTAIVNYTLTKSASVSIEVINILGEKVTTILLGTKSASNQEYPINLESLSNGIYFVKLNAGETNRIIKITVSH